MLVLFRHRLLRLNIVKVTGDIRRYSTSARIRWLENERFVSAVYNHAEAEQIFIASESVPANCTPRSVCPIRTFVEKRHFLLEEEYRSRVDKIAPWVEAMREAIAVGREQAAETPAESESVEHTDPDDASDVDECEDED